MRDRSTLERHLPADGSVEIVDHTSAKAVLNLCGPRSRDVLARLTDAPLDNASFPYMSARELDLAFAPALALRVTYLGELGYELHVPVEYALDLYERLWAAGVPHGIANVGYRAINSLRLEKHYLVWGSDITPDYNPYEAGLGFCVALRQGRVPGARRARGRQGARDRGSGSPGSRRRRRSTSSAARSCWPATACWAASPAPATGTRRAQHPLRVRRAPTSRSTPSTRSKRWASATLRSGTRGRSTTPTAWPILA